MKTKTYIGYYALLDICVKHNLNPDDLIEEYPNINFSKMMEEDAEQFCYKHNPDNHNHI